ncbi:transmembrane protein, putative (macronuclear) [Tetrahymena thermophila SB210]|uniref:Transmembrane protein, putative n=1 Tax=Tetrahymena thermophila (strain SB210) TaxID=312017 RepID=Q23B21_TETTS|nr:transmembrane protein, putative [Tetrahymena thermophila SB210]EAR93663.2 transmembrane protein, putative [Tetrahymena thermophila SB210]|eukprot:XP_001013908.2 transmembrane protein, putative [Tetrahymena thermophila SB210]
MKIACFSFLFSFIFCYDKRLYDSNLPIFEPFPTAVIDRDELCSNGSTYNIALFTSNSRNMIALNLQQCGFAIYDITDPQNNLQLLKHFQFDSIKDQVISLSITNSDKLLWVSYATGILEVYDISQPILPLMISTNITYNGNLDNVNQVIQLKDLNFIFLVCFNNFKLITWQNNDIQITKTIDLADWYIDNLKLALNQNLLIAQGSLSLHFYQQSFDDLQKGNLYFICTYTPSAAYSLSAFEVIQESILVIQIDLYQYIMIDIRNYISSFDGSSCDTNKITYLDSYPSNPLGGSFALSMDQKYLYTQQSSLGVLIFDVSQKKLEIFQTISTGGTSMDIQLSSDGHYLYYSNWFKTQIFQLTNPNLNLDVPNLLLNQYQLTSYNFFKGPGGSFDNQIIYQEPQNVLYMARKDQGSAIFQYEGDSILNLVSQLDNGLSETSVSYQVNIPGTTIFYQSREILGLQIVDFKNISNPVVLKTNITLGLQNIKFEQIIFKNDGKIGFIANVVQLIVISIEDVLNPKVIKTLETSIYLGGDSSLYKFSISNDQKTLLLFPEFYGIVFADIEDPKNPKFLFKIYLGQIYFLQQTIDSKYLICGVSFQGVFIYLINSDRSLTLVSTVLIQGVVYFQWLIYNDNYLIVTTAEIDSILLVNIIDKTNPIITQIIYFPENDPIYWLLTSQDQSFIFASAQYALYQLFIQSPIIFHSQIYKLIPIANSNQYSRKRIQSNQVFQVGDQIEIYLVDIYQSTNLYINKALYYINFVVNDLPSWIQYSPSSQVLRIQVAKESLIADSNGKYTQKSLQQVILLSYQKLSDDIFENKILGINQDDSIKLKQVCMNVGYIDKSGFVAPSYSPNNVFNLGLDSQSYQYLQKWNQTESQLQSILEFIQFKLNQNIINYVIQFYTEPSLKVNFTNSKNPIQSNQDYLSVTLQIFNGKFVSKLYPGILVLINSEQDTIQLQGTVKNINLALYQKISLFFNQTSLLNSTKIQITIDDFINYKYIDSLKLLNASFISFQSPVVINTNLQSDFNQQYEKGEIAVQTPFSYKVSDKIFKCLDSPQLFYSAKMKMEDNSFKDISSGYWLSFSSTDRTFFGTAQLSQFNSEYTIVISATDGYTSAQDEFKIKVNIIPFFVVFQIIVQIVGPLLGVFGIWKYRTVFYNIIFKFQIIYTNEIAYVSEYYEKNIIITDNQLKIARILWKYAKNSLKKKWIQQQIDSLIMKQNIINQEYTKLNVISQREFNYTGNEQLKSANLSAIPSQLQHYNENENYSFQENKSQAQHKRFSQRGLYTKRLSISHEQTNKPQENIYKQSNFKQNRDLDSDYKNNSMIVLENIKKRVVASVSKIVEQSSKSQIYSEIKNQLFESNGKIAENIIFDLIFKNEQKICKENQIISKDVFDQLLNNKSRLFIMIKSLAVEHFIECSPICKNIALMLKQKALETYKEIDWYKQYVISEPQQILDDQFPIQRINYTTYQQAFEDIVNEMSNNKKENIERKNDNLQPKMQNDLEKYHHNYFKNLLLYQPIIEEYLYSVSLGISDKSKILFQVSQGDCLHCSPQHVRSIKCFETNKVLDCCVKAQNFLEINQVEKGLSDNQRLPEWMQVNFQKSHITIKGTPDQKSVGLSRIKIFDSKGYLLRQFDIEILDQRNQNEIIFLQKSQDQNNQLKNSFSTCQREINQSENESPGLFKQQKNNMNDIFDEQLDKCFQKIKSQKFQTLQKNSNLILQKCSDNFETI